MLADLQRIVAKRLADAYQPKLARWYKILNRNQLGARAERFRERGASESKEDVNKLQKRWRPRRTRDDYFGKRDLIRAERDCLGRAWFAGPKCVRRCRHFPSEPRCSEH
jgi:hypothetical protein